MDTNIHMHTAKAQKTGEQFQRVCGADRQELPPPKLRDIVQRDVYLVDQMEGSGLSSES